MTDGGTATATLTYAIKTLPRSTANRPDGGVVNKYRVMYVLPSDGADRNLDTDGTIIRTLSSIQRWFASQTGGRHLRLDMSDDALDITFARIGRTDAAMTSYGDFIRDTLEKELVAGGYSSPNTLLLVYYDGGHQSRCGSAATPPALVGPVGAIFLKGLAASSFPCANNPFAATPWAPPTYIEFTAAHEALHLLGIVSAGAPDFNNYHVDNDPTDLMYAGAQPWHPVHARCDEDQLLQQHLPAGRHHQLLDVRLSHAVTIRWTLRAAHAARSAPVSPRRPAGCTR